ncbi:MAG TPA: 30S ribosomal protein S12 methylthiotransferase RimO [Spirochaetota bacterium]|nr:30S ribosomal protein S12 methylthiotransferase RimO [Spirochaetota bacterium]
MKKVYIETLGCSKNQIDSEKISHFLSESGYLLTDNPSEANYIIVNTCGFIEKAKQEAIDIILEYTLLKEKGVCEKLVVAGCLAQRYPDVLQNELNDIDLIFGIGDISKIVMALKSDEKKVIPEYSEDKLIKRNVIGYPGSAYLRISDGCSNHCSYCAIPLIRGDLRSRKIEDILSEVDFLLEKELKEIIIIAQDTSNYGIDRYNEKKLVDLTKAIDKKLKSDMWLRVLYMHPDHIDDDLITGLKELEHFIPYFDIPFQSGSDKILQKMGRKNNSRENLNLIKKIRNSFKEPIFRSSFIVGFPDESNEDFNMTLNFIEEAEIDWVGAFDYSDEEGTKAHKFKNKVKDKVKETRLNKLMDSSEEITFKNMTRFIGTKQKILIEEATDENLFIGRFWGQAPDVDGLTVIDSSSAKPGNFIEVNIKRVNGKDLFGVE